MRTALIAGVFLSLALESCGDLRAYVQKHFGKKQKINNEAVNEAIKTQLDEYFATVNPIDEKYNIPAKEVNDMKTVYQKADEDKDGKLSLEEMRSLVNVNHALSEAELQELLKNADTNNDNQLSMEELASYITRTEMDESTIDTRFDRDQFRLMDLNKDSKIDMSELQRLYRLCNENFNRQLIDKIVTVTDQDKDKQLDYDEMSSLLKSQNIVTAGSKHRSSEIVLAKIKHCIQAFIDKCKDGFCDRSKANVHRGEVKSWKDLVYLPFTFLNTIRRR